VTATGLTGLESHQVGAAGYGAGAKAVDLHLEVEGREAVVEEELASER
jgi:hypothetical protein